jgi:hypothetical protein
LVPRGGGYATSGVCIIGEAAVGTVLAVCGAGGDRAAAYPRAWHAGDRSSAGSSRLDHFPGIAAQCRHPRGRPGLSGNDRAVARRPLGAPSQAGQAGGHSDPAQLCAGASGRHGGCPGRSGDPWAGRDMERAPSWAPAGPAVGPAWSPEQIARRLRLDFPEDQTMRIRHEAIYQALFIQGRGHGAAS